MAQSADGPAAGLGHVSAALRVSEGGTFCCRRVAIDVDRDLALTVAVYGNFRLIADGQDAETGILGPMVSVTKDQHLDERAVLHWLFLKHIRAVC